MTQEELDRRMAEDSRGWDNSHLLKERQYLKRHYRGIRRSSDRLWFHEKLPMSFLQGKEIHHDWENGETCYLLEIEKHKELHK